MISEAITALTPASIDVIVGRSRRQTQILELLTQVYALNPESWISGRSLDFALDLDGASRHVAPLRIKLRRHGWDIQSCGRGFRLATWREGDGR